MTPFSVICLNNDNKPDGIPTSSWLERGKKYTVTEVAKMRVQGGILGFKLAELNIDDCIPYQFFAASRFGLPIQPKQEWAQSELDRLLEEAKEESLIETL